MATVAVYCVEAPSGKCYVGITSRSLKVRWQEHILAAKSGSPYLLHVAIRKYSPTAMKVTHVATCATMEDAHCVETSLIAQLSSLVPGGYNMTRGGDGVVGVTWSDAQNASRSQKVSQQWSAPGERERRSSAMRGVKLGRPNPKVAAALKGKTASAETREKLSLARKGHVKSEEWRANLSIALRGRKGRAYTEEERTAQSVRIKDALAKKRERENVTDVA